MTPPVATYRLQFRNGMTFDRAAELVPYLARLGISHLYASPLFAATPGSTHGYDGIDFSTIETEIGGKQGFERFCAALDAAGLQLLLDFVPNHMAASDRNPWWRSVLEWGAASAFSRFFDIDWSAPKLVLPVLGQPYEDALRDGTLGIAFDAAAGSFTFTCHDRHLPLTPPSYGTLLAELNDPAVTELSRHFRTAGPAEAETLKQRLAEQFAEPRRARVLAAAVDALNADPARLHDVHEAQPWRLVHWRQARKMLTYRRFFEITDLICLRVEDPEVFDAVHARLFELIAARRIAGVRLDHIDGLADPKAYLERFQEAVGGNAPFYLLVEKILEGDEKLRPDWPVAGTTGYEFMTALAGLFVDRQRESAMTAAYDAFTGTASDYATAARAAKREIFTRNLAAELATLTERAQRARAAARGETRRLGSEALRRSIVELATALPVYRTYVGDAGLHAIDRATIATAAATAKASGSEEDADAVDFIAGLLLLDGTDPVDRKAALSFAVRFQQTTGPVMAKAIEDTLFYRFNRLMALNEVGGMPERYGAPLADFHALMTGRQESQPTGLSATATHDTKRGEDARARLHVLSEMPEMWQRSVDRWAGMNRPYRTALAGGPAPEPAIEWLFYQALAGAWPTGLGEDELIQDDSPHLAGLRARMTAYMEKAIREAKTRTSWTEADPAYEAGVRGFVEAVLSTDAGRDFLLDFCRTCRPIRLAGAVNGLAQLAVKLLAPGIPDIYQGTELWDVSLVDPDNRAPVDFVLRQQLLERVADGADPAALLADWTSGAPKMALMAAGLRLRTERPALFAKGAYVPLTTTGAAARHVFAFARQHDDGFAVLIAPRLVLGLVEGADRPIVPPDRWRDAAVVLPDRLRGRSMRDAMTGKTHKARTGIQAAAAMSHFPVAMLVDAE